MTSTHICRATRRTLESLGYTVVAAGGGRAALELFTAGPDRFDLVVTDIQMPGLGGLELLKRIRAIRPTLPVILTTGYSEVMDEAGARALGASDLLQKPFTRARLAAAVQAALAAAGTGRR